MQMLCGFVVAFFFCSVRSFAYSVWFSSDMLQSSFCLSASIFFGCERKKNAKFSGYLLCARYSAYAIDKCDFSPNEWPHDHINT